MNYYKLKMKIEKCNEVKYIWICVGNEMPDYGTRVLAFHAEWGIGISYKNKTGNIPIGLNNSSATHWMDLPNLPNKIEYILNLNESEIKWLKSLVQNPIGVEDPDDEHIKNKLMRMAYWNLLKNININEMDPVQIQKG